MQEVKVCRCCGVSKTVLSFYRHRRKSDGRQSYCMECARDKRHTWRKQKAGKDAASVFNGWLRV